MMRFARTTFALGGLLSFVATGASAQAPLTLADVTARAREQAPQIVAARLAVEEARGRLAGASLRVQSNPDVDFAVGSRSGIDGRSTDLDAALTQRFEPPSRRAARLAGANAAVDQRQAILDDITRIVLSEATSAFYRALHAGERIRLLNASETLAASVHQIAERRYRAGDVALLDVNIARASLARARAERQATIADRTTALAELKRLLRLESEPEVAGTLVPSPLPDASALLQAALLRPEIRELEAAIREAEADVQFGRSLSRPDYGLSMRYEREEGAQSVLGGITLSLPLFSKGQERRAVGSARAQRLRSELDAARERVRTELQSALAIFEHRVEALQLLERDALPGLDENEMLVARSFEVGQIGLADLLLIRREILDTRFQYLDAQLQASLARIAIEAAAGVVR